MKTPHAWRGQALMLVLAPALAAAQSSPPASTTATMATARPLWIGMELVEGRPSSLRVLPQTGKDTVQIAFSLPRPCRLTARPTHRDGDAQRYALTDSTGGRCDRWYPGSAVLRAADAGAQLDLGVDGQQRTLPLWAAGSAPEEAALQAPLAGRWTSVVRTAGGQDLDLTLQLQGREPGDEGSTLSYGSPRSCRVPLRYEGRTEAGAWFAVLPGNGGAFCDALVDRWLVVGLRAEAASLRIDSLPGMKTITECVPNCSLGRPAR